MCALKSDQHVSRGSKGSGVGGSTVGNDVDCTASETSMFVFSTWATKRTVKKLGRSQCQVAQHNLFTSWYNDPWAKNLMLSIRKIKVAQQRQIYGARADSVVPCSCFRSEPHIAHVAIV
jgi:hypothetical protein